MLHFIEQIFLRLPIKFRLYFPIIIGIIISITIVAALSILTYRNTTEDLIKANLKIQTQMLTKMIEREYALKKEKVKTNIQLAHALFYIKPLEIQETKFSITITNQFTLKQYPHTLNTWIWNKKKLFNNSEFIDHITKIIGGTVTVFERIDSGYVRIATNVKTNKNQRAIGTFIPNSSPVVKTINVGQQFIGRAFVVNDWYITAYDPIIQDDSIVGMLYVGNKENDLNNLRQTLNNLILGKSGFVYIINENKEPVIRSNKNVIQFIDSKILDSIIKTKNGFIRAYSKTIKNELLFSYQYSPTFKYYVITAISPNIEMQTAIANIISTSIGTALLVIIIFSIFLYFHTLKNVHSFLKEIETSNKTLNKTQKELKELEKNFLRSVIQAEEKERERLSKELHDGLGPLLSTIKLYVSELLNSETTEVKEQEEINKYSLELIDEAISTTRNISNNLMPRIMTDFGLIKALESFIKKINLTNKINIQLRADNYSKQDQTIELIMYRVINELINNTIKHALAQSINISIILTKTEIQISYIDDGIGFDIKQMLNDPRAGMGLKNILSRINSVDGVVDFKSNTGKGIAVSITMNKEI